MRGYLRHQCCESAWKDNFKLCNFQIDFFSEHLNDFSTKESYFLNFVLNFFIKLYSIAIMTKINILKRFYRFQLQIIDVLRC